MKYILAITTAALLTTSAHAEDSALETAVRMTATDMVFMTKCKPTDAFLEQLRSVSRMFQDAAGVDADNRQFVALTKIRAVAYLRSAEAADPAYCRLMREAFERGARQRMAK